MNLGHLFQSTNNYSASTGAVQNKLKLLLLYDPSNHDGVITHHSVCYHPGTRRSQVKSRDGDTNEQWLNAYSRLSAILSTLNILGHLILIEAHELGTMNSHYINEESQAQRCRICQNQ